MYIKTAHTHNSWTICRNANKYITQELLIVSSEWLIKQMLFANIIIQVIYTFVQISHREKNLYNHVKQFKWLIEMILYQICKKSLQYNITDVFRELIFISIQVG